MSSIPDVPVGWATLALAIATTALAVFAYSSARDAKKQVEVTKQQVDVLKQQTDALQSESKTLEEQTEILRNQFEANIKPVITIFGAPVPIRAGSSTASYSIVIKNLGNGMAICERTINGVVKNNAGVVVGTVGGIALGPGEEWRVQFSYTPLANVSQIWKVSVSGVKDILGRSIPDITDFPVTYPP